MTNSVTVTLPASTSPSKSSLFVPLHPSGVAVNGDSHILHIGSHDHVNGFVTSKPSPTPSWRTSSSALNSEKLQDNNVFFGLIILVWYFVSVGHNLLNKRLLEGDWFPFPFTLTLLQLASITFYSYMYIRFISASDKHVVVTLKEVLNVKRNRGLIIFLSLGKFLTLVFSHLSLSQVPLAFTHTVKGSLPLFVVFLSRVFLGQSHSRPVYYSLIPIVLGVGLVSYHPSNTDNHLTLGILFAFMSTLNLALLNVFSKRLLSTSFSAISLLHLITKMSLVIFVPFYIVLTVTHSNEKFSWSYVTFSLPFLLILDGIMSFSQNILAFSLLSMCSPLTYSIANCSKRVAIISLSFVFFSIQHLTFQSMLGIGIALFGIFAYNVAKHAEKEHKKVKETSNTSNGYDTKSSFIPNGYHPVATNADTQYLMYNSGNEFDRHSLGSFYNV